MASAFLDSDNRSTSAYMLSNVDEIRYTDRKGGKTGFALD